MVKSTFLRKLKDKMRGLAYKVNMFFYFFFRIASNIFHSITRKITNHTMKTLLFIWRFNIHLYFTICQHFGMGDF